MALPVSTLACVCLRGRPLGTGVCLFGSRGKAAQGSELAQGVGVRPGPGPSPPGRAGPGAGGGCLAFGELSARL